jgi:superfamily I DNA/RNA helicase
VENFDAIRRAAAELRLEVDPGFTELHAAEVVKRAIDRCELTVEELGPDDPGLAGSIGVLDRTFNLVLVSQALEPAAREEVIAHEIGHFVVHEAPRPTVAADYSKPGAGDPAQRIEAYGVKERREAQANVFARELLLPRALARQLFMAGERAAAIADRLGIRRETVFQQLTDALLLPDMIPARDNASRPSPPPDQFQEEAIVHRGEAFLLEAGPGTGKTKTLVERISRLLKNKEAQADEILALTFSNKAAGEIADRVEKAAGAVAANIWTGTFHAFGLELLRKYHEIFGKGQDPRLIDGSEAIHLLEDSLPTLPIVHLQNLFEPALALRDIFRAISRAKDELASPADYAEKAEVMAKKAAENNDADAALDAAKAAEVALVYKYYQAKLDELQAVDYGDLVMLPALKLRNDAEFAKILRARFKWIHVDEYQDINRASAVLIKGLAGEGNNLWVVGDARQSIYRFRGASTANMAQFKKHYPVSLRRRLGRNYRSTKPIVSRFMEFGNDMQVSDYALPLELETERDELGTPPSISAAADTDAEMDELAGAIRALEKGGTALRDQAILARSNGILGRVGDELEARGIPVLYLGPLFDRPEIRDLLSLLAIVGGADAPLLRVAGFPEYGVPLDDVVKLLGIARETKRPVTELIVDAETLAVLSVPARMGLERLGNHLQGFHAGHTPWFILMEYLFERSGYVVHLTAGQTPRDEMRRVAVRQLVEAMRSMPLRGSRSPIKRGLDRVRHMVLLADDRELRRLPDELAGLDGVQLLTIHGSKGLEFEAVHLPCLYAGTIPAADRQPRCPPPAGLIDNSAETDSHVAEEECLFFVALSRARTHLRLYRAARRAGKNSNPSAFLSRPGLALPVPADCQRVTRIYPVVAPSPLPVPPPPAKLKHRDIERYDDCPRRFYYERVASLRGDAPESAYLEAHRCLLTVLDAARESGVALGAAQVSAIFEEAWSTSPLVGHVFETSYRNLTEAMLAGLLPVLAAGSMEGKPKLSVEIGGRTVELHVDQIIGDGSGTIYRTIRAGKQSKGEADKIGNSLLLEAVNRGAVKSCRVETFHLADAATTPIEQTDRKKGARLETSRTIVAAIDKGEFPPKPSDWSCPRCRYFFLCPAPVPAV